MLRDNGRNISKALDEGNPAKGLDLCPAWIGQGLHRHTLGAYAAEHNLPATLNMHQWGLIENVMSLLAPFEELTKKISSSTATAADVIPAITALKWLLERRAYTDHGVATAKTTII